MSEDHDHHGLSERLRRVEQSVVRLEERLAQWMTSVERRFSQLSSVQKWALGVMTTVAVGLVLALVTRGL